MIILCDTNDKAGCRSELLRPFAICTVLVKLLNNYGSYSFGISQSVPQKRDASLQVMHSNSMTRNEGSGI